MFSCFTQIKCFKKNELKNDIKKRGLNFILSKATKSSVSLIFLKHFISLAKMFHDEAEPEDENGFVAITSPTLTQADKNDATTLQELKGWYSFQVNIVFDSKGWF
jgi:hypothetical protein